MPMDTWTLTPPDQSKGISLRAYAARRGVSPMAVTYAIRSGRLSRSVGRRPSGFPTIVDPDLADREWAENTDQMKAAGSLAKPNAGGASEHEVDPDDGPSFAEAAAREKLARARLAELEYQERVGRLVDVNQVMAVFTERITRCRTRLLGVPSKLKSLRPNIDRDALVTLDALIRETLEEVANDGRPEPDEKSMDVRHQ